MSKVVQFKPKKAPPLTKEDIKNARAEIEEGSRRLVELSAYYSVEAVAERYGVTFEQMFHALLDEFAENPRGGSDE